MTLPSKTRIAEYWAARSPAVFLVSMEEPGCFACEWQREGWEKSRKPWEAAKLLQRCHLRPKSLGGPGTVENMVVLCVTCHREAPDYVNPEWMIKWIQGREHWIDRTWGERCREFERAVTTPLARMNVTVEDIARYIANPRFAQRFKKECTVHQRRLQLATVAAALAQYHLDATRPASWYQEPLFGA